MPNPQIEKLLIVQERDMALQRIELELKRVPLEREKLESAIAAEEALIQEASHALKAKEVERHELDLSAKAKEAEILRYKNQQLQVKKNEEYRALTQQIEQCEAEISRLEEVEIGLMLEIDQATVSCREETARLRERITRHQSELARLAELETNLQDSEGDAQDALTAARRGAEPHFLEHYDRVRNLVKRPPYVVEIIEHKCGGCHLRVSNEVSKSATDASEPVFCDQCGRMVYA